MLCGCPGLLERESSLAMALLPRDEHPLPAQLWEVPSPGCGFDSVSLFLFHRYLHCSSLHC